MSVPLCDISDGGSGCAADALSGNPCPNPAVAFFGNTCEAGMMCGTVENQVPEWRATAAVRKKNRRTKWLFGVNVELLLFLALFAEKCRNLNEILIL